MNLEEKLQDYYKVKANGETKLQTTVKNYIKKFGGIYQKDYDDFYSVANECVAKAIRMFDEDSQHDFDTYIKSCLIKKIKTEMTKRNRQKRSNTTVDEGGNKVFLPDVSLDVPIEDGETTLGDTIPAKSDLESLFEDKKSGLVEKYLSTLSITQKKICEKIMEGLSKREIKAELGLEDGQLANEIKALKSFEKANVITENNMLKKSKKIEGDGVKMSIENSCEKSMRKTYSVETIVKKMRNKTFRFDYAGQRMGGQWPLIMQSNLVSDVLQGNPIPDIVLAEEVNNGFPIIWNIDGKQRCTTLEAFRRDVFNISSKVKRYMIRYGSRREMSTGSFEFEWMEFDIRGKKYSQLPEELKEKFDDYTFEAVQYINCSKEEIDYHIRRYNEGKPMTASQKGIAVLGYDKAQLIKSISSSEFFQSCCNFGKNDRKNGATERVAVESVMTAFFTNEWKKSQEIMFQFVGENVSNDMLYEFDEYLSDLAPYITDETATMFTTADAFLFLGTYVKARRCGVEPQKFVEFLSAFKKELHKNRILDNKSFDDVVVETRGLVEGKKKRGTKDSSVVIEKMDILFALLNKYFKLSPEEIDTENKEMESVFKESDFAVENNYGEDKEVVKKSIEMAKRYCKSLDKDGLAICLDIVNEWALNVDSESKILSRENVPALVGVAVYAFDKEIDRESNNWFVQFAKGAEDITVEEAIKDLNAFVGGNKTLIA